LVIKILDLELNPDPHWYLDPDPEIEKMLDLDPYPDPHFKSMRIHNPGWGSKGIPHSTASV
jgi:hypothetical protein